jgi:MSHA biogenesis protein MshI
MLQNLQWPWQRKRSNDRLVFAWFDQVLTYLKAYKTRDGRYRVIHMGVVRQGSDSKEAFAKRLNALGLTGASTMAMLRPEQYQILTIDTPNVAADELKSAARWQIKDQVEAHLDDISLDVVKLGDGQGRAQSSLFVITAANKLVHELSDISEVLHGALDAVDVQDMAQRNLQTEGVRQLLGRSSQSDRRKLERSDSKGSRRANPVDRAHASIVLLDQQYAMLTICCKGELFYRRRIELGEGFMQESWLLSQPVMENAALAGLEDRPIGETYDGYPGVPNYVPGGGGQGSLIERFTQDIQRSLDLWDRSWLDMPLQSVLVFAGSRTQDLVDCLTQQLVRPVLALDVSDMFVDFDQQPEQDQLLCWPLLGVLLRTESRTL